MKTLIPVTTQNDTPENFVALLRQGMRGIMEASQMLARMVKQDPEAIRRIIELAPEVSQSAINKMLKVGEGALHPALLLNGCPAYQRLALLPYSAQEAAVKAGSVSLVVDVKTGDSLRVPIVELTPAQVTQVISPTGLRSKDEQAAFIRRRAVIDERNELTKGAIGAPYIIRGKTVIFNAKCTVTQSDLLRILSEMSK